MRLVIMGPPGAGKGTHSKTIADTLQVEWISTGDMFRSHIKEQTELGVLAQSFISRGEFVPDEVTDKMVAERIMGIAEYPGFLLDGYPRSIAQAQTLDAELGEAGLTLDQVFYLDVSPEVVIGRLLHRAEIEGREDDTEPVIRHRLEVYFENTQPLLNYYEAAGKLLRIPGEGTIEEVHGRVEAALQTLR